MHFACIVRELPNLWRLWWVAVFGWNRDSSSNTCNWKGLTSPFIFLRVHFSDFRVWDWIVDLWLCFFRQCGWCWEGCLLLFLRYCWWCNLGFVHFFIVIHQLIHRTFLMLELIVSGIFLARILVCWSRSRGSGVLGCIFIRGECDGRKGRCGFGIVRVKVGQGRRGNLSIFTVVILFGSKVGLIVWDWSVAFYGLWWRRK